MDADEERVKCYFEGRGFLVNLFSKKEKRAGKTPDFRVQLNNEFVFYCEVKSSPPDAWLDNQLSGVVQGELAGGVRSDPIFNRLAADIYEAAGQFNAFNEDQNYPNVLALVNHDKNCGFDDLVSVLTGNFYSDSRKAYPIYRQFSHGRIKEKKDQIHLFIWLDDNGLDHLLFSQMNSAHHASLCKWLGVNLKEIQQIHF